LIGASEDSLEVALASCLLRFQLNSTRESAFLHESSSRVKKFLNRSAFKVYPWFLDLNFWVLFVHDLAVARLCLRTERKLDEAVMGLAAGLFSESQQAQATTYFSRRRAQFRNAYSQLYGTNFSRNSVEDRARIFSETTLATVGSSPEERARSQALRAELKPFAKAMVNLLEAESDGIGRRTRGVRQRGLSPETAFQMYLSGQDPSEERRGLR